MKLTRHQATAIAKLFKLGLVPDRSGRYKKSEVKQALAGLTLAANEASYGDTLELEIESNKLGFKLKCGKHMLDITKTLNDKQKAFLVKEAEGNEHQGKTYCEVDVEVSGSVAPAEREVGIMSPYAEDLVLEITVDKDKVPVELDSKAEDYFNEKLVDHFCKKERIAWEERHGD